MLLSNVTNQHTATSNYFRNLQLSDYINIISRRRQTGVMSPGLPISGLISLPFAAFPYYGTCGSWFSDSVTDVDILLLQCRPDSQNDDIAFFRFKCA